MSLPHSALKALLTGLIDYAGLFPPAGLPLDAALRSFTAIQDHPQHWMAGRFILPAARMEEAADLHSLIHPRLGLPASALGTGGSSSWESYFDRLDADLASISRFRRKLAKHVSVTVFESALPPAELAFQIRADALTAEAAARLDDAGLFPFFEAPFGSDWDLHVRHLVAALAALEGRAGLKIRTGGLVPEAFPGCDQLARAMRAASEAGVPVKFTAGLHHPIRHFNESVGTKMHGFLNVFGGAALLTAADLSAERLAEVLAEEDPAAFEFADGWFRWREIFAPIESIRSSRADQFLGFGSCSFDEPLEDLVELGLL